MRLLLSAALTVCTLLLGNSEQHCRAGGLAEYRPGRQERRWIDGSQKKGEVCKIATSSIEAADAKHWLAYAASGGQRAPTAEEADVLSQFRCSDGSVHHIEPLTGMARHPFAPVGCRQARHGLVPGTDLMNTSYLVLTNGCKGRSSHASNVGRRHFFFDLGCGSGSLASYRFDGTVQTDVPKDASGAVLHHNSIGQFASLYQRQCISFDRIYAWDAHPVNPAEWWAPIPVSLRAITTFFNIKVEQEPSNTGRHSCMSTSVLA